MVVDADIRVGVGGLGGGRHVGERLGAQRGLGEVVEWAMKRPQERGRGVFGFGREGE